MRKPICCFVVFYLFVVQVLLASNPLAKNTLKEGDYVPNTVLVKMKSSAQIFCKENSIDETNIQQVLLKIGVNSVSKMFPGSASPSSEKNKSGKMNVDLSLIYKIKFSGNVKLEEVIRLFQATEIVECAEPKYIHHLLYTPNDPQAGSQYHLTRINALNAWDVWKGDTNMVIGIVDKGEDWNHPDLVNSIKYNYADPIDGLDNDGDGYTDNFRGWDVSENDNSPMVGTGVDHGTHVAGCAAASTDNSLGVAAPGFNCKILAVKACADASANSIDDGYEGIFYAMTHGVKVINCSWGRSGGFSQIEQDVINDATFNHDITMVAAAGNDYIEDDYYPASYDHVLSVAATDQNDVKANFSDYGFKVDVCAPGVAIWSTIFNDTYGTLDGTSMSSPIAAGCVAMIRSKFPAMDALQAAEQLKATCDTIYSIPGNGAFTGKLGAGRVNLFKALTETTTPGVDISNLSVTDLNDNIFLINDTLHVTALFTNLLAPITNLTVTLSSTSTFVTILNNTFNAGNLNTNDTISNLSLPFSLRIEPTATLNASIPMKMTLTNGSYTKIFSFYVVVNVDYINIAVNNVSSSATSIGRIGFNTSGPGQGLGFTYKGSSSLLYEAGLMLGCSDTMVSDNMRNIGSFADSDFRSFLRVKQVTPGVSDFDTYGKFDDSNASTRHPLPVLVQHRAFAWTTPADSNYIIFQYTITNTGTTTLNNFFAGIFTDWDVLPTSDNNRSATDFSKRMGYTYCTDAGGYYAGVKLLTFDGFLHYAIDNDATGQGGINMSDSYSTAEKYASLSTNRLIAGAAGSGNEVCDVTSTGPFTINAGDSIQVAFAILAAKDLATLQASADAAQHKYDAVIGIPEIAGANQGFSVSQNFPNPSVNSTTISFTLLEKNFAELTLCNVLGEKVQTVVSEKLNAGTYRVDVNLSSLKNGIYFYRLTSGQHSEGFPLIIAR